MIYLFSDVSLSTLKEDEKEKMDLTVFQNRRIICEFFIRFSERINKGKKSFFVGVGFKLISSSLNVEAGCQAAAIISSPLLNNINRTEPGYNMDLLYSRVATFSPIPNYQISENYEFSSLEYKPTIMIDYSSYIKTAHKSTLNLRGGDLELYKLIFLFFYEASKFAYALTQFCLIRQRHQLAMEQNSFNNFNKNEQYDRKRYDHKRYDHKRLNEEQISALMRKQTDIDLQNQIDKDLKGGYQKIIKKQQELGGETTNFSYDRFKNLSTEEDTIDNNTIAEALSAIEGERQGFYKETRRPIDHGIGIRTLDFIVCGQKEFEGVTHMDVKRPVSLAKLMEQNQNISIFKQGERLAARASKQKNYWTDPNLGDKLKHLTPEAKASLPKRRENVLTVFDLCRLKDQTEKTIIKSAIYKNLLDDDKILFINDLVYNI